MSKASLNKIRHLSPNIFGSAPVDIKLVEIINEHLNSRQTRKLLRIWQDYTTGTNNLSFILDKKHMKRILLLWEAEFKRIINETLWPIVVKTHFVAVIVGHKRKCLKGQLHWQKNLSYGNQY